MQETPLPQPRTDEAGLCTNFGQHPGTKQGVHWAVHLPQGKFGNVFQLSSLFSTESHLAARKGWRVDEVMLWPSGGGTWGCRSYLGP
jgi:hypothetical protein